MKEKLTNNIVLKIASVLFAIIVWLIVLNINDPNKTVTVSDIEVDIINDEAITSLNKSYTVKSGGTCEVTVSGPRSVVDQLDADDFTAIADVKDLSITNSIPIKVELKKNTYASRVDIVVKTNVKLNIEDIIEQEYSIEVRHSGETEDMYVVTNTKLENETVVITAPRSQIDKIKSVVTYIDVSGKNEDFETETRLRLYDINGDEIITNGSEIVMSDKSVKSKSTVLYMKEVDIKCELPESINDDLLISGFELSENSIMIIGRKAVLDKLDSILLPVDLENYELTEKGVSFTFNVDDLLPENTYNYGEVEEIVLDILIDIQDERTITTNAKNISISNIPDGFEAALATKGNISYVVRGNKALVDSIDEDDIVLKVDIGELTEGTHRLKVLFVLPDGMGGLEIVDDLYVEVSLALIEEETSENESESNSEETSDDTNTSESESDSSGDSGNEEESTNPIEDDNN